MATLSFAQMVLSLGRPNAPQWRTHIRRRNRKGFDGADAVVRSVAASIRVLVTWSLFDNPFRQWGLRLARFTPRVIAVTSCSFAT
jgi:hypothetical protein